MLAVKLIITTTTTRRVSPVEDIATDPVAALFAGLTNLPKGHRREAINLDSTPSCTGARIPDSKSTTCPAVLAHLLSNRMSRR